MPRFSWIAAACLVVGVSSLASASELNAVSAIYGKVPYYSPGSQGQRVFVWLSDAPKLCEILALTDGGRNKEFLQNILSSYSHLYFLLEKSEGDWLVDEGTYISAEVHGWGERSFVATFDELGEREPESPVAILTEEPFWGGFQEGAITLASVDTSSEDFVFGSYDLVQHDSPMSGAFGATHCPALRFFTTAMAVSR